MRYEGTVYRPPGEWKSYLLQVTVGCSHNACTFCGMYKDKRYRVRPLEEIFEDIALAKTAYGDVKRVFLCDGDAVAMDTGELLAVLARLYQTFPTLERVNAYAGPGSTLRKTEEELAALRRAGLVRLYLGVVSPMISIRSSLADSWATKHHDPDPGRPESNLKQALIVSSAGYNPPRLLLYPWASRMQPNISCSKSSW